MNWDKLENILRDVPRLEAQRVDKNYEDWILPSDDLFSRPARPVTWDYARWRRPLDLHGDSVSQDLVIQGRGIL